MQRLQLEEVDCNNESETEASGMTAKSIMSDSTSLSSVSTCSACEDGNDTSSEPDDQEEQPKGTTDDADRHSVLVEMEGQYKLVDANDMQADERSSVDGKKHVAKSSKTSTSSSAGCKPKVPNYQGECKHVLKLGS